MSSGSSLSITKKGLILVAVPLIFELAFVSVLAVLLKQADKDIERELKAKAITQNVLLLNTLFVTAAIDIGAFHLSKDPEMKKRYNKDEGRIKKQFAVIRKIAAGNKKLLADLAGIEKDIFALQDSLHCMKAIQPVADELEMDYSSQLVRYLQGSAAQKRLTARIEKLVEPELVVATQGARRRLRDRGLIEAVIWLGILFNVLVAFFVAMYFGRSISSRIGVLADNTFRFAKGQSLNEPLKGNDEIAHLDTVFHEVVEQIVRVDQMKKEFLAMVSHDLRSPLMNVQGILTLMTSGVLGDVSEKAQLKLRIAESDVERLISLINDLLDTELLASGELTLDLVELPLSRVLERSMASVSSLAEKQQIDIVLETYDEVFVKVDEGRLIQVIVNLLSNAIKFSKAGDQVILSLIDLGSLVELRIANSGRGIPAEMLSQVFERFRQVEKADAKEKGGSGLGLYICKRIIESHGGEIGVDSEYGQGSTFWIRIQQVPGKLELTKRSMAAAD